MVYVVLEEDKIIGKLLYQPDASTDDALEQILNLTAATVATRKDDREPAGTVPENLACAFVEYACRSEPAKQRKLVELVSRLQKQKVKHPSTGEQIGEGGRFRVWTDLPSLSSLILRYWNDFAYGKDTDTTDLVKTTPEELERFGNLNAFLAQLTQAAPADYDKEFNPMDISLKAVWTMCIALEGNKAPEALPETSAMRAACMWFIYAADALWAHVTNAHTFPDYCRAGPGPRYKGKAWNGFNRERWLVWEQGLQEARATCTKDDTRKMIDDALAQMKRAAEN